MEKTASQPSMFKRIRAQMFLWSGRVHRHYGITHSDKDEFMSAVEDYGRALKLDPRLAAAHLERGILLWRELGRATHAIRDLNAALTLRPNWPEALFTRGLAHQATGNYYAAMDDLNDYINQGDQKWQDDASRQLALIRSMFDKPNTEKGLG